METLFKKWRKEVGITQKEAAELLGVHINTVKQYEAGKYSGTGKSLELPGPILRLMTVIKNGIRPMPYE